MIEHLGKGLQTPEDTIYSVKGNGRKWASALATRTPTDPARFAYVGDSITEGLDGSYVEAFRKRAAPLNGFKNGPGWVHGSQDVANIFNVYKWVLTTGTAGSGGQNVEDVHAISTSGWLLASGSVVTLEEWSGPLVSDYAITTVLCDRVEFHYTVRGDSGSAGSLTFAANGTTLGVVNTVDTSIGAGNYEIRTVTYALTRGLYGFTVTGSGGQPSIFGGAYFADGDSLYIYPVGDSGDEFSDMNMTTSGRTIQGLAAIDADCVMWMHGTNNFHAGDAAAAATAGADLETAIVNTRAALPNVTIGYGPPYPAQSRTTWPLFVNEWKRVCAKNDVPVCDFSTMLLGPAATSGNDPFDLIHDGGSIANTHPNPSGAEYMADQLARFVGLPGVDWVAGAEALLQLDSVQGIFSGVGFAAGLVITKHDTGKAYLQLRDDKWGSTGSTGLIGEIGMNGRGATGLLGAGGVNSLAWLRFRVPSGSWSDTSAPLDLEFGNCAAGSVSSAVRVTLLAGGGWRFAETASLPTTATDKLDLLTRDDGSQSQLIAQTPDGVVRNLTPRTVTTASSSTPTPNVDIGDLYAVTALAANATFGAPTGTPYHGQRLMVRVKDNGTSRTLGWNAIYRVIGVVLPTATVANKTLYVAMIYNATDTKWDVLAVGQET